MAGLLTVLPYAAVGTGAGILGGVIAALWKPPPRITSVVQHFAAGVVLGAAALELLPEIEAKNPPAWAALGGASIGAVCMYLLRRWADSREASAEGGGTQVSFGLIGAIAADVLMDGVITGAGFAMGEGSVGPILAIGLSIELLFLGLSLSGAAGRGRSSDWAIFGIASGVALLFGLGTLGAAWALSGVAMELETAILSFGAAALIYLVTEELLTEAHEKSTEATNVLVLFFGFISLWGIRYLGI